MAEQTKLLILDLDETLVFATEDKLARPEDFRVGDYFVYKRPGLDTFLRFALEEFKVAVWTASGSHYAEQVRSRIFPDTAHLEFAWARDRCTLRHHGELQTRYWIKDLKKVRRLGYSLESVLVIDDTARKLERSYGNHISVSPFRGQIEDTELAKLEAYLLRFRSVANVRAVDKRNWRHT